MADDLLAEALARPPDDERVDDVGVAAQHVLDLLDEDLLAAAVHDQRVAAEQDDRAVGARAARGRRARRRAGRR